MREAAQADSARGGVQAALEALVMACLARLFARLENLIRLWQSGQLVVPAIAPGANAHPVSTPALPIRRARRRTTGRRCIPSREPTDGVSPAENLPLARTRHVALRAPTHYRQAGPSGAVVLSLRPRSARAPPRPAPVMPPDPRSGRTDNCVLIVLI